MLLSILISLSAGADPGGGNAYLCSEVHLKTEQYGCVNLPHDVASFAQCLPQLPSNPDVIVVRRGASQNHTDFRVRQEVVRGVLQWLVTFPPKCVFHVKVKSRS